MASVSKCPYCGADVRSDEKNCPGCGAPNELYVTETPAPAALRPKTMAELLDFAAQRRMPLEKMRFFVGRDYREPKAFGIYRLQEQVKRRALHPLFRAGRGQGRGRAL